MRRARPSCGRVGLALALLLAAGLLWGLTSALASSASPSPSNGQVVLRLGWLAGPDNLNPFVGTNSSAFTVWYMNYDTLVGLNTTDVRPNTTTGLATAWKTSPDGKSWTFTIRKGVKWQDGVPLTAGDVAWTYNDIIKNQIANWTAYTTNMAKATALDDTTVRIDCSAPSPALLTNVAEVPILPAHVWAKIPNKTATSSAFSNTPPLVGSGPFECVQWKKSDYLVMQANKSYWRGAPHVDEVVFEEYTNADTMGEDMKSGAIDGCLGLLQAQMHELAHTKGVQIRPVYVNGYDELGFNCYTRGPSLGNPVLKDWRFRQALQWAVDHDKIVQIAYGGLAQPADSVLVSHLWTDPDWHWTPPADEAYHFDLAKAGQMLTAAGYPLKNGVRLNKQGKPIVLRLWTRSDSDSSQSAGKLIAGWFDKLGLKIDLSVMADGAIQDGQYNMKGNTFMPNYDMFLWGWGGDPDPNFIMSIFTTAQINSWSDCAWSNAQYDKLFLEQQTTIDPVKRADIVHQMEQMIYEQSPYIPTAYPENVEAYNDAGWQGWQATPGKGGGVFFTSPVMASYLTVHPVTKAAASGGSSSRGLLIGVVVAIVVVIVVVALVATVRGRGKRVEETV